MTSLSQHTETHSSCPLQPILEQRKESSVMLSLWFCTVLFSHLNSQSRALLSPSEWSHEAEVFSCPTDPTGSSIPPPRSFCIPPPSIYPSSLSRSLFLPIPLPLSLFLSPSSFLTLYLPFFLPLSPCLSLSPPSLPHSIISLSLPLPPSYSSLSGGRELCV